MPDEAMHVEEFHEKVCGVGYHEVVPVGVHKDGPDDVRVDAKSELHEGEEEFHERPEFHGVELHDGVGHGGVHKDNHVEFHEGVREEQHDVGAHAGEHDVLHMVNCKEIHMANDVAVYEEVHKEIHDEIHEGVHEDDLVEVHVDAHVEALEDVHAEVHEDVHVELHEAEVHVMLNEVVHEDVHEEVHEDDLVGAHVEALEDAHVDDHEEVHEGVHVEVHALDHEEAYVDHEEAYADHEEAYVDHVDVLEELKTHEQADEEFHEMTQVEYHVELYVVAHDVQHMDVLEGIREEARVVLHADVEVHVSYVILELLDEVVGEVVSLDALGLAPVLLPGRQLLRTLCLGDYSVPC